MPLCNALSTGPTSPSPLCYLLWQAQLQRYAAAIQPGGPASTRTHLQKLSAACWLAAEGPEPAAERMAGLPGRGLVDNIGYTQHFPSTGTQEGPVSKGTMAKDYRVAVQVARAALLPIQFQQVLFARDEHAGPTLWRAAARGSRGAGHSNSKEI